MKNKFDFFEVVRVIGTADDQLAPIHGQEGTILGMSQGEESRKWGYAVSMTSSGEVWDIDEEHLESTGQKKDRSDFYTGKAVRVKVDPVSGEGSLG